jgi:hypothetical protein
LAFILQRWEGGPNLGISAVALPTVIPPTEPNLLRHGARRLLPANLARYAAKWFDHFSRVIGGNHSIFRWRNRRAGQCRRWRIVAVRRNADHEATAPMRHEVLRPAR